MTGSDIRRIAILHFDDMEELDAVGPYEVLAYWIRTFPEDGFEITTLSFDGGPVTCAKGLVIGAHESVAETGPLAVLVHPGGQGTRRLMRDHGHLEWLREQRKVVPVLASVCTGALVLAAAGLLHDRPATTHWTATSVLAELDPTIDVRADARYVDDGDVVTSAGVSAGIDMALHLVGRLSTPDRARQVARGIQYDRVAVG